MWRLNRERGKVYGANRANADGSETSVAVGGHGWNEFLAWNKAQVVPLSLEDEPYTPPPEKKSLEERLVALEEKLGVKP